MKYKYDKKLTRSYLDIAIGLLAIVGWLLFIMFIIYPKFLGSIIVGGL